MGDGEKYKLMKKLIFVLGASLTAGAAMAQMSIVNNIAGTFTDISGTGTDLLLGDDGVANIVTSVGNGVFAAGNVRVGNNGGIGFGATTGSCGFSNAAIPGTGTLSGLFGANPVNVIAPYWDDWDSDTGGVFWQEIGGTLIIQWNDRPHFSNSADHATMQVQVFSSGPVFAQVLYESIEGPSWGGGASATIGYLDGTSGMNSGNNIQYSFNTAGAVADGTVLSIVPEPGTYVAIVSGLGLLLLRRKRS